MSMASSNENHGDFKSKLDINKDNEDEYPSGEFEYKTPTAWKSFVVNLRMLLAYPWLKVRKGSVLNIKLRGKINDQLKSRFSSGLSLPQLCENLIKAAYDPHISGVYLHIETLKCGWGITEEIRRHILDFRKSGKRKEEIESFINEGVYQIEKLKEDGWITDIKYDDEVTSMLKTRLGIAEKKKLPLIDYKKYSRIKKWSVGLSGGKDRIAVIRASGKIRRVGGSSSSGIIAEQFIKKISKVRDSKRYKAVIIRIDSGGGDALASDLMWRETKLLAESKPVVASMVDMAASGGYYMAMAAHTIVSENLTLTGSIGVVTGPSQYPAIRFLKS